MAFLPLGFFGIRAPPIAPCVIVILDVFFLQRAKRSQGFVDPMLIEFGWSAKRGTRKL
jgi:hypothetical protein